MPLDSRRYAVGAASLYQPARRSARMVAGAIRVAARLRVLGWVAPRLTVELPREPELERRASALAGREVRLAIQARRRGDLRGTVTMAAINEDGEPEMFVRVATTSGFGEGRTARDIEVLRALATLGVGHGELCWSGRVDGRLTLIRRAIRGRAAPVSWGVPYDRFLRSLEHDEARPIARSGLVDDLRATVRSRRAAQEFAPLLERALAELDGVEARPVVNHRDFAPWNLVVTESGELAAFDWECGEVDGIAHVDRVAFELAVGVGLRGWRDEDVAQYLLGWEFPSDAGLSEEQARAYRVLLALDRLSWRLHHDAAAPGRDPVARGSVLALRRLLMVEEDATDGDEAGGSARPGGYSSAFQQDGHAAAYDARVYAPGGYDEFIWELQRPVLRELIRDAGGGSERSLLDFACGTGRILAAVEDLADSPAGLDISAEMVGAARTVVARAEVEVGDITSDRSVASGPFDVVTAFRFFLNAEPSLRRAVMPQLASRLRDRNSRLIFNVHGSRRSVRRLTVRGRSGPFMNQLSPAEVETLIREAGLEVVEVHGFGVTPGRLHRTPLRPVMRAIDRLARRLPFGDYFAIDLVYVARLASGARR